MKNAVIYARFSTDLQRQTSVEDQARICTQYADLIGVSVSAVYSDEGVSGTVPVAHRSGGTKLLADALAGRFEVLIIEGLDRLSRDQVEQERTVRRFEYRNIRIVGVSDGYDSELAGRKIHRTMRGLINEIYLDDLRHKTHRGLAGQLARGGHAGGLSYGYRSVPAGAIHKLEIVPEQADLVRWIFERYAAGWSCQQLASDLNKRGIPSGRGGTWAVSALYGSPAKGSGVLCNELYIGRQIWNRSQWVKDPDTDKRTRLERPREEWIIEDRPELRIVSDALWAAVRERMGRPTCEGGSAGRGRSPRTLFGGLIRCGKCGGSVVATSGRYYGCTARKDRGESVCKGIQARRDKVDARLLEVIREELMSPDALVAMQAKVRVLLDNLRQDRAKRAQASRARLEEIDKEVGRLVDAITSMGISPALQARLKQVETERELLAADLAINDENASLQIMGKVEDYRKMVSDLEASLSNDHAAARELIRKMIGDMNMVARDGSVFVEIQAGTGRAAFAAGLSVILVAGAGFGKKRLILVS